MGGGAGAAGAAAGPAFTTGCGGAHERKPNSSPRGLPIASREGSAAKRPSEEALRASVLAGCAESGCGRSGSSRPATATAAHATLHDVVAPQPPPGAPFQVRSVASDLSLEGEADKLVAERPGVIFHLAAVVSGEAEADFEKGYRVNLDGTRQLFEAIRRVGAGYKPRVVFTSSIAVFGAPFPGAIDDEFLSAPLTSYGTQKAMAELLLSDYTRRGFFDGIGIRLPTVCVRPGKPNRAASGFFSGIIP